MAPFFGAGGPMQLWLPHLCRPGLYRSSGLQKAQVISMTRDFGLVGLADASSHHAERGALDKALETLQLIQRDWLDFADWTKE
jgi:hypothetical protein